MPGFMCSACSSLLHGMLLRIPPMEGQILYRVNRELHTKTYLKNRELVSVVFRRNCDFDP
jgi:hypothetical protein